MSNYIIDSDSVRRVVQIKIAYARDPRPVQRAAGHEAIRLTASPQEKARQRRYMMSPAERETLAATKRILEADNE